MKVKNYTIKIDDTYSIKVDRLNFTVVKKSKSLNRKTNEECVSQKILGHCANITCALSNIFRDMTTDKQDGKTVSLTEHIDTLKFIEQKLEESVKGWTIEDVETENVD